MIYNSNFSSPVSFLFSGIHWRAPDGTSYPLDFGIPHLDRRWRLVVSLNKWCVETGVFFKDGMGTLQLVFAHQIYR